jgi:hypothetical protein
MRAIEKAQTPRFAKQHGSGHTLIEAFFCLVCFHLTSILTSGSAHAQAFGFSTGWYAGISSESLTTPSTDTTATLSLSRKIPLLFEFHSASFFNGETRARLGLRLHIYSATSKLDSLQDTDAETESQSFTMTSILLSYQYLLSEPGEGYFIFDVAGGFSIFSSGEEAERRFSLVPGLTQIFRLSSHLGLQAGLRLHVILGDSQKISPFKSGLLLNVGLSMEG